MFSLTSFQFPFSKWLAISFSSALSALSLSGLTLWPILFGPNVHSFFILLCLFCPLAVLPVFTFVPFAVFFNLLPLFSSFFKMIGELRQIHRGETKMAPLFNYFFPLVVLFPPLGNIWDLKTFTNCKKNYRNLYIVLLEIFNLMRRL